MCEQYQIDIFNARKSINPDVYLFDIAAFNSRMKNINEIRQANFQQLVINKANGVLKDFAALIEMQPARASHLNTGFRNIGDSAARRIENAFALPRGWMDREHSPDYPTPAPAAHAGTAEPAAQGGYMHVSIEDVIQSVEDAYKRGSLPPEAMQGIISLMKSMNAAPPTDTEHHSSKLDKRVAGLRALGEPPAMPEPVRPKKH